MKPLDHAESSAKSYGGTWEDYIDIHEYMDASRRAVSDMRHRIATHNTWFVYGPLLDKFGPARKNSEGKLYSVSQIGEDHCREDLGGNFPTLQDWCTHMDSQPWMCGNTNEGSIPESMKTLQEEPEEKRDDPAPLYNPPPQRSGGILDMRMDGAGGSRW